jgi:hypothetical protein
MPPPARAGAALCASSRQEPSIRHNLEMVRAFIHLIVSAFAVVEIGRSAKIWQYGGKEPNAMTAFSPGALMQWADLAWLPVGLLLAAPRHRLYAGLFVLACVFTLRQQVELLASTGHPYGYLPLLTGDPLLRGQIAYGIVTALFFLLLHFSKKSREAVVLSASIVVYIFAFCISMVILAV